MRIYSVIVNRLDVRLSFFFGVVSTPLPPTRFTDRGNRLLNETFKYYTRPEYIIIFIVKDSRKKKIRSLLVNPRVAALRRIIICLRIKNGYDCRNFR